jgi:N-acetylneuraminic acid mutarotase
MMKKFSSYLLFMVLFAGFLIQGCKKNTETIDHNESLKIIQKAAFAAANENFESINWGNAKSITTATHEVNGEVVNNKLYIFGGHDYAKRPNSWTQTKRAYVYDPIKNTWSAIADLPHLPNGAGFGGVTNEGLTSDSIYVYFAGGYVCNATGTGQVFATKQVWKYNTLLNKYERLPDLPRPLAVGQLKYLHGKLHFMGGADLSRNDVASHYVLDLNNLSLGWQTLAPLINPVNQSGSAILNDKIYVIGGSHNHDAAAVIQKTVQVYDETANKWNASAPMSIGRDHISSAVVAIGSRILVFGGESAHNVTTKLVSAYSPATNTWAELTTMPGARSGGVAALLNNQLYYAGGNFLTSNFKGVPVAINSTAIFSPTDDTFIRDGSYSGNNYGSETTLSVKGSNAGGYTRSVHIKFSLVGVKNPLSAKLRLFGYNADNSNDVMLSCFQATDYDWTETNLTFNNALMPLQPAVASAPVNSERKYIELDITNFVNNQLLNNINKVDLVISDASKKNSNIIFNSKEATVGKPELIVNTIGAAY